MKGFIIMFYVISMALSVFLSPVLWKKIFDDPDYELKEKIETMIFTFGIIFLGLATISVIIGSIISSIITPVSYSYDEFSIVHIDIPSQSATIVDENKLVEVDISSAFITNDTSAYIVRKISHLPSFVKSLFLSRDRVEYIYYYPEIAS